MQIYSRERTEFLIIYLCVEGLCEISRAHADASLSDEIPNGKLENLKAFTFV